MKQKKLLLQYKLVQKRKRITYLFEEIDGKIKIKSKKNSQKNIFQIKINLNLRDFIRQIKFISLRIKNNERVDFFSEFVSLKIYYFWYCSW